MQWLLVGPSRDDWEVLTVPVGMVLGGWDVPDLAMKPGGVVPGNPLDDRPLELSLRAPGPLWDNELRLERGRCVGVATVPIEAAIPASASRSL